MTPPCWHSIISIKVRLQLHIFVPLHVCALPLHLWGVERLVMLVMLVALAMVALALALLLLLLLLPPLPPPPPLLCCWRSSSYRRRRGRRRGLPYPQGGPLC